VSVDKVDLVDTACPGLGLADDQRSHLTFADSHHRCHGSLKSVTVERAYQRQYCLTGDFVSCDRFLAWRDETAAGRALLIAHAERGGPPANEADETPAGQALLIAHREGDDQPAGKAEETAQTRQQTRQQTRRRRHRNSDPTSTATVDGAP
jgi:hypothetical protein